MFILKLITQADRFGALSQISFFDNQKFKTIYGGILSLLIYSLGCSYIGYLMYMWQTYQLTPTITVQQQFDSQSNFTLTRPLYVFSLEVDESNEEVFELQQKGQIFQYQIGQFNNGGVNLTKNAPGFQCGQPPRNQIDFYDPVCMNLEDAQQTFLFQNYMNRTQDSYVNISIDYCDPKVYNNCLSFDDQSKIYNQYPSWRLTLITQEVNLINGNITDIPQDYYFDAQKYQQKSSLSISLRISKGTYLIDTGIFFRNIKVVEIVRSIELVNYITQYTDINNNVPMIAYIDYHLDRNEQIITVTHPKLAQILADLGSIFQLLLTMGFIMYQFNYSQMQIKVEKILLDIYFPEIKLFEFNYNWKGKIKSISHMGTLLANFDFERMKLFRRTTGELLRSKLNYLNILHEISRLQMQLQLKVPQSEQIIYQSLGYRIILPKLDDNQMIVNEQDQDRILDQRDFQLLCFQKHEQKIELQKIIQYKEENKFDEFRSSQTSPNNIIQLQKKRKLEPTTKIQQQLTLNHQIRQRFKTQIFSSQYQEFAMPDYIVENKIQSQFGDKIFQPFQYDYVIPEEGSFVNRLVFGQKSFNFSPHSKIKTQRNLNQTL